MNVNACAKLNLTLDILRKREDGYHDLQMVMQSIDLSDTLTVTPAHGPGQMSTNLSYLPSDGRNLAQMAAAAFRGVTGTDLQVDISICKRIPVCAGMAGGSTDAAAVLRALNELTGVNLPPERLAEIGQAVGSDVPYCVMGGTAARPAPLSCGGVQARLFRVHPPAVLPGGRAEDRPPPRHGGAAGSTEGRGSGRRGPPDV